MTGSRWLRLAAAGLIACASATNSTAAELLVFECDAVKTWKDGTVLKYKARIEIVPETMFYVEYHDYGGKKSLMAYRGIIEKIDPHRIIFADTKDMLSYIDRSTGESYSVDRIRENEDRSTCKEVR